MSNAEEIGSRQVARNDFDKARRRAVRSELNSKIRGKANRLIPFEEIRAELRQQNAIYRGVHQIPIDKIIGSVGRYNDFTKEFLPLSDAMAGRWINVQSLTSSIGWPPIELYKVADAYFVRDGNHRTAIARQMDLKTIEAQVWEFETDIEILQDETVDEVLIKIGLENFERKTNIASIDPNHNIHFTAPGRYSELKVQIENLRSNISRIDGTEISFEDAVPLWYELIYLPTLQIIEDSGLIEQFPGRTEADLFVWLSIHRHQLAKRYGDYDNLIDLATVLTERYKKNSVQKVAQVVNTLIGLEKPTPMTELEELEESKDNEQEG